MFTDKEGTEENKNDSKITETELKDIKATINGEDILLIDKENIISVLEGLSLFKLLLLYRKIEWLYTETYARSYSLEQKMCYETWLTKIEEQCFNLFKIQNRESITVADREIVNTITSNTNSHEGNTKKVFIPEGDKVYAIPGKTSSVMKLLYEIACLDKLRKDGLTVPKTYLDGFQDYHDSGLPEIILRTLNTANVMESVEKNPGFAMDKVEGDIHDPWKSKIKFKKEFIDENKYNDRTAEFKNKLIAGLSKLAEYLGKYLFEDLQFCIKEDGELVILDPGKVLELADIDDKEFFPENLEEENKRMKEAIKDAVKMLNSKQTLITDRYLLTVEECKKSPTEIIDLFNMLNMKIYGELYTDTEMDGKLNEEDLKKIAEVNSESDFVELFLSSDQITTLSTKFNADHTKLKIPCP